MARAIPLNRNEGGTSHASTFRFELRDREDPRFADRRMQSLLRVLNENLHEATATQTSQLLYSVVKLRLPEDFLITALTDRSEELLHEMTPKDLAVTIWSMARLDYPASEELKKRLSYAISSVIKQIKKEPYLVDSENDPHEQALLDSIE